MQCFGCFAADVEPTKTHQVPNAGRHGATSGWSDRGHHHQPVDAHCGLDDQPAKIKSKLRLLDKKSSSKLQAAAGPTYTPASASSPEHRDFLRRTCLMQHGRHSMSISTLQQDPLHHFVMPGIGYIAFAWMSNYFEVLNIKTAVALADPVCDPKHFKLMAEAFLQEHPQAIFIMTSYEFACVLQDLGFFCNHFGGETQLDIATYSFSGYARRGLRSAISSAIKEGLTVEEVMAPAPDTLGSSAAQRAGTTTAAAADTDWSQLVEELVAVDAAWASKKAATARDVWFINRPPVFAPEAGVRKFVARNAAGQLQGYIFFDGVFEGGQLVGYYANITRMAPDAHPGTLNLIIKEFLDRVRAESQLAAPVKKLSMRKSQRKKLEAAAASAVAGADAAAPAAAAAAGPSDAARDADQLPKHQQASAPTGPKFLSLGVSPFYQMDNKPRPGWRSCTISHLLMLLSFHDGEAFYPFKSLAAAKAKYGAGLRNGQYEDPNVRYIPTYQAHNRRGVAAYQACYDLCKLYGFWKEPSDAFGKYANYKGRQGAALVVRGIKKATDPETYKPKPRSNSLSKASSLSSSFGSSSSNGGSSSSKFSRALSGLLRSKSAPAEVSSCDKGAATTSSSSANATTPAAAQKQKGKVTAAHGAAVGTAAAAAAAATSVAAAAGMVHAASVQSDMSLIEAGSLQPGAPSTISTLESLSDCASNAPPSPSSSTGNSMPAVGCASPSSGSSDNGSN